MTTPALTLLFDGKCPFCTAEMSRLRRWGTGRRLAFVDMSKADFEPRTLGLEMSALDRELHSIRADGTVLTGIDSMLAAYSLVGRGWLVWPLRVRPLRPMLGALYRSFARNRYRWSRWLGYKPVAVCESGACRIGGPFAGL